MVLKALRPLALLVGAAALTLPATALGASEACDAAYEHVQSERAKGRYGSARKALLFCARPECGPNPGSPGSIERDCATWLEEDLLKTPTLVLGARDANGNDLLDVHVTMDGAPLALPLDGKPIEVDAGERSLVFERHGTIERRKVIARYGQRGVPVVVTLGAPKASGVPERAAPASPGTPWRVTGLALAGVGLVGLGVGVGFAVKAEAADAEAGCDPFDLCSFPERRRDAQRAGGIATVALLGGGGMVIAGTLLALLAPSRPATPSALRVTPLLAAGGGGAGLSGAF